MEVRVSCRVINTDRYYTSTFIVPTTIIKTVFDISVICIVIPNTSTSTNTTTTTISAFATIITYLVRGEALVEKVWYAELCGELVQQVLMLLQHVVG